ncbi:GIY-YIG nuclease family protein [Nodosilinea sp. LEGE 06152]|uniref:GIY-YIG nuclease family protein n=1 Tax=Nodosilinea sp. LEGE 06152 TaxID=2777966 RepID=UPI00187F5E27|nr:GIY-YIG nuclease family protein [Nodosilinea sp. LEGE 06152]MBE9157879.1 GIY-YIG nuclease family protein [Nodosilinea sp. LEGE 06152]
MTEGVYLITCTATGDQYVGWSAKLAVRWEKHRKDLVARRHHNSDMQSLADEYGIESFTFEVLETSGPNSIGEYAWIAKLQPTLNGTGTKRSRAKHTERMRVIWALRKTEPEFRRQQAIAAAIEGAIAALEKHEDFITPRQRRQLRQIAGEDEL